MAITLPNGAVIPDGGDRIPENGVDHVRNLGASIDAHLGAKASRAEVEGALAVKADLGYVDQTATALGLSLTSQVSRLDASLASKADAAAVDARLDGIANAYQVAQAEGFGGTVTDWLASLIGEQGPEGPYGGTEVTDPQVASYVTTATETRAALEAAYRRSVSVAEYGATGDGATDDTTAVQAALTGNPGGSVYFPPGTYRLTGPLTVPADTFLSGADSASTMLDWSTMPGFIAAALLEWGSGELTSPTPLAADSAVGDPSVTVQAGHGFAAGDYVRITTEEVLFAEMTKAEFHRVLEVDGATLHLSGPVFDRYTVALGARVERANLVSGGLRGVSIRGKGINPTGYGDNAVRFALGRDVHVSDVKFADVENKCIQLDSVLGATVHDCHFRFDPSRTPLQYGVAIQGASQMVSISSCSSWNDRHMVTTATSQSLAQHSTALRGIPRIIAITGCTAHGSWQCPVDTHRGGEYVTVTGCALNTESTGIKFRGRNCLAVGNVIIGKRTSVGGAPYGVRIGMLCDSIQITGNTIRNFADGVRIDTPDGATRGMVISENSILDCVRGVGVHGTTLVSEVRIAGNTIRALAGGYAVYVIAAVDDLEVIGNTLAGGAAAVYMAHSTRPINRLVVNANTARENTASYGMFFRNVYDGLVTANFSPAKDIRFSGVCERVTTGLNQAVITDLTTGTTIIQK